MYIYIYIYVKIYMYIDMYIYAQGDGLPALGVARRTPDPAGPRPRTDAGTYTCIYINIYIDR